MIGSNSKRNHKLGPTLLLKTRSKVTRDEYSVLFDF
jgi:hypothetical protein